MRKIISKTTLEKKQRRNQLIVGIILVVIMFSSTIGYSFVGRDTSSSDSTKIKYNGYEFNNQNNFWVVDKDRNSLIFRYNPSQVPAISSSLNGIESYVGKPLYIYSDDPTSYAEISVNMGYYALRIQSACPEGVNCSYSNAPVKSCEDNFIIIKKSNESSITQDSGCVFILSPEEQLVQTTDEFLFKLLLS